MKVAIIWDGSIGVKSYYVKDKIAYTFEDNKPYTYHHSISPQCFSNTHNWNFLWDEGYFLNLNEWVKKGLDFPELDLDLIFYACERDGLRNAHWDTYSVERLRKKYPNATIVGYLKEVYVSDEEKFPNRIKFLKECDYIHAEAAGAISSTLKIKLDSLVDEK